MLSPQQSHKHWRHRWAIIAACKMVYQRWSLRDDRNDRCMQNVPLERRGSNVCLTYLPAMVWLLDWSFLTAGPVLVSSSLKVWRHLIWINQSSHISVMTYFISSQWSVSEVAYLPSKQFGKGIWFTSILRLRHDWNADDHKIFFSLCTGYSCYTLMIHSYAWLFTFLFLSLLCLLIIVV